MDGDLHIIEKKIERDNVERLLAIVGSISMIEAMKQKGILTCESERSPITIMHGSRSPYAYVCIRGVDRRLVFDQDFGWMYYNAEGPED